MRKFIFVQFVLLLAASGANAQQPASTPASVAASPVAPNSRYDDYAASFRRDRDGRYELWFTSSPMLGGRSRAMMVSRCGPKGFESPTEVASEAINPATAGQQRSSEVVLNGVPSFSCRGNEGVFVSNRRVNGADQGNDLYWLAESASGEWRVSRLTDASSPYWDDTPFLSPDGQTLYWSSDRRLPGSRKTDIYYARREGNAWSDPLRVPHINTDEFAEESPCLGPDGYFYFSTNRAGRFTIYRAPAGKDGLPMAAGSPIPIKGVNTDTTDATHPVFSPGGRWFLYSSNSQRGDIDIKWVRTSDTIALDLQVRKHTRSVIEDVAEDKFTPVQAEVAIRGDLSESRRTDALGRLHVPLIAGSDPASELMEQRIVVTVVNQERGVFAPHDTILYVSDWPTDLKHEIYLTDTSGLVEPPCKLDFPIAKVQFFIEGYWGPTTFKYRNHVPTLASFFTEPECLVPEQKCDATTLFAYEYTAKKEELYANCFKYKEFRDSGRAWATNVDKALDSLVGSMRNALNLRCVREAVREKTPIDIVVEGFTDPKPFKDLTCSYVGETVNFAVDPVRLVHTEREQFFVKNTNMRDLDPKEGGNQLLSDLRAYYAARLLDTLWRENIPEYQELRERGLVFLKSNGRSKSSEVQKKHPEQRSIAVSIDAETRGTTRKGLAKRAGQRFEYLDLCGKGVGLAESGR